MNYKNPILWPEPSLPIEGRKGMGRKPFYKRLRLLDDNRHIILENCIKLYVLQKKYPAHLKIVDRRIRQSKETGELHIDWYFREIGRMNKSLADD